MTPHALTNLLGGNPDQRRRNRSQRRANRRYGPPRRVFRRARKQYLEQLRTTSIPLGINLAGHPYVIEGVDTYSKYQSFDDAVFEQQIFSYQGLAEIQGRPGYFIFSQKLINATSPVARWATDLARGRKLKSRNKKLLIGWYAWPFPGSDAYMVQQAQAFLDLVLVNGQLPAGEFLQIDSEQSGLSAHMVQVFADHLRSVVGDRVICYTIFLAGYPDWRARYRASADYSNWYSSEQYCVDSWGFKPIIHQWGGGVNGAFVLGINGGQSRVDSNVVFDWTRVLQLAATNVAPPPLPPSPPPLPPPDPVPIGDLDMPTLVFDPTNGGIYELLGGVAIHIDNGNYSSLLGSATVGAKVIHLVAGSPELAALHACPKVEASVYNQTLQGVATVASQNALMTAIVGVSTQVSNLPPPSGGGGGGTPLPAPSYSGEIVPSPGPWTVTLTPDA